jgi:uncharacterized protein YcbX
MLGEELDAAEITEQGVVGDRAYALIDASDHKVASAKNPRKWGALLGCEAQFVVPPRAGAELPPVRITLPDGTVVHSDEAGADIALSKFIGRPVRLATTAPEARTLEEWWPDIEGLAPPEFIEGIRIATDEPDEVVTDITMGLTSPPGTFFDLAVLHLMTTATLDELRRLSPGGELDARRFRPNLVIAATEAGFAENGWLRRSLRVGEDVQVTVSLPVPRCVMTTMAQAGLPRDPRILRALARHNRLDVAGLGLFACAGVYADLVKPGTVRRGDAVLAM